MLLLGFAVLIAGVVVWLVVTSPEPAPVPGKPAKTATKPATEKKPDAEHAATDAAHKTEPIPAEPADKAVGKEQESHAPPLKNDDPGLKPHTSPATDGHKAAAPDPAAEQAASNAPETPPPATPSHDATTKDAESAASIPAEPPSQPPAKPPAAKPGPTQKAAIRALVPKKLPPVPRDTPLSPSPDPALVQVTALGPLPRIGPDGRMPRSVYAKPFDLTDKRPRVAIVVSGLGLSAAATESAIQGLPGSVTLAFAPYSTQLNEWIRLARAAGHEVLINVPMEPTNYPAYDPGPQTLLTSLNAEGNLDRLLWSLSRGTGYVGVVDFLGSRFTTSRKHMQPVLKAIHERGLLYLDSGSSPRSVSPIVAGDVKLVWAMATLTLDQRASRTEIDRKFGELEQRAKRDKRAIGIASPYPVSLERIATWVRQLEARGIAIAPVSALAETGSVTGTAARK